jgi:hypothetical protein
MKTRHSTRSLRQKIREVSQTVSSVTKSSYGTSTGRDFPHSTTEQYDVNNTRFPPLIFGNNELSREKNAFSIELWQNLCITYMILDITDFQQNRTSLAIEQLISIYDQMMLQYAYSLIYHYSDIVPIGLTVTDLCHIKHDNQVLDSHERFNYYQFKFIQVKNHLLNIYLPIWKDLWKTELEIDLDSSSDDGGGMDIMNIDLMDDLAEDDLGYLLTKFRHLLHSSIESHSHSYGTKLLLSWLCFLSFYMKYPSTDSNNRLNEKAADFRRKLVLLEFNPLTSLLQYNPMMLEEAQPQYRRARNCESGSSTPIASSVSDLSTQLPPIISLCMNMEQEDDDDDPLTATAILINQQQQLQQNPLYFLQNPSKLQSSDYLMFIQQLLLQQQQMQQTQQQVIAAAVSYTNAVAASAAAVPSFPSVPLSSAATLAQQYINASLGNISTVSIQSGLPQAQQMPDISNLTAVQNTNSDSRIIDIQVPTKRGEKASASFDIIEFPILMTPSSRISRAMHPRTLRIWQHLCSSYAIMEYYLSSSSSKGSSANGRSVDGGGVNRLPQQSKQDYIEKAFHRYCERILKIYSEELPNGISIYELQGTVTGHQICFSTFTNMSRAVQIIYIPAYEHLIKECLTQFGPNFVVNASNYDQILFQLRAKIWKLEHLEINANNDNEQQNESVCWFEFLSISFSIAFFLFLGWDKEKKRISRIHFFMVSYSLVSILGVWSFICEAILEMEIRISFPCVSISSPISYFCYGYC